MATLVAAERTRAPVKLEQAPDPRRAPKTPRPVADRRVVLAVATALLMIATTTLAVRTIAGRDVTVAGTILDARTKKPIPGVFLKAPGLPAAKTDAAGSFRFAEVKRGARIRIGAKNYKGAFVEASADPLRIRLTPIPVTGKVTSVFTGKGIAATVYGKEANRSRADGTFSVYGVGPGNSLKFTAFAHAPMTVKIGANRKVTAALKLGTVDPNALLTRVAGYGYVDAPAELVAQMRAEMAQSPEFNASLTGVAAKSVLLNGETIAIAIAISIDPGAAALPFVRDGFFQGVSEGAAQAKTIKIGDVSVRSFKGEGFAGYAWQRYSAFVTVIGSPADKVEKFTRALILGKTVSA